MELPAKYNPAETEDKWYAYWIENKFFHSEPDEREPFTIVIPPPNVTGVLHMGHMLNNTLQDVLVRRARMKGKNACWVPGTDHASIATEAKVVAKLKENGIEKSSLTREKFLEYAWDWRNEHGGIILKQLRKLGASCDWDRTRFTMDPDMTRAVINTFVYFYKKGMIYRGVRMVNWDPEGHTAVSDEEVIHKDVASHLYYLKYPIADGNHRPTSEYVTIATTRPETIMADAAVCINPEDERYRGLRGKTIFIPLINREIPIIEDPYVEIGFGTGCLKVTPAHDVNDYEIGLRHNLPVISIIDDHGKLNGNARILVGEDRFAARKKIVKMLENAGFLLRVEDYTSPVGFSERTNAVIEPMLSKQWFLKMDSLSKRALSYVEDGSIRMIPDKFKNVYRHWMETAHDWCISRQLWWGQQIPAYYLPDGRFVVESTREEALKAARKLDPSIKDEDLKQDEDVLDTWFSSWLWPISVFDPDMPGHPDHKPNRDLAYYFPTDDLVTAPEILFFWVARMVMSSDEFMHTFPFRNVYLTGIVRDKLGRKMSKQLGNSPDPVMLMQKYGADGVRLGMLLCSSAGNDILYDDSQVEQGRNFCNKIWNAFRLVNGWKKKDGSQPAECAAAVKWFGYRLDQSIEEIDDLFDKFRISEAGMCVYRLFWDDFCSWYLEIVKPSYGEPVDCLTFDSTLDYFDKLLKLIHPFMPFITEELWHDIAERKDGETIMLQRMPEAGRYDASYLESFQICKGAVQGMRAVRQEKGISPKVALNLRISGPFDGGLIPVLRKLENIGGIDMAESFDENMAGQAFMVGTTQFFVPLEGMVDVAAEIRKAEVEIRHYESFLSGVNAKLSNEQFIAHAPEQVVELERKKKSDAMQKIENLHSIVEKLKK
ncbi:MAG: valine--tRNA ligase [Bacteroidales bacterium]|jgi:valyl-tRNA synthetase|nr:valine--tRNA ligase [Bacteroidales bacterium]MCI2122344.1 valine--tRNA ligase [Bacteroidales bacterium]MCI2146186.1 valine--tRNA ligase [Bacteroidales bacterium]